MVKFAISHRMPFRVRANSAYYKYTYNRHEPPLRNMSSELRGFKTYYLGWLRDSGWLVAQSFYDANLSTTAVEIFAFCVTVFLRSCRSCSQLTPECGVEPRAEQGCECL